MRRMLARKFNTVFKLLFTKRKKSLSARTHLREHPTDAGNTNSRHAQEPQRPWRNQILRDAAPVKTPHTAAQTSAAAERHAAFLIKAPVATAYSLPATSSSMMQDAGNGRASACLAGLCILCVGGRAALYPSYRSLVEGAGGRFLIYRGDRHDMVGRLPALLLRADAVICPVDCVNHASFFHVKQHCMRFSKPCALLERSSLPAFRRGIETLVAASSIVSNSAWNREHNRRAILTFL
jgi:hypothetical protein